MFDMVGIWLGHAELMYDMMSSSESRFIYIPNAATEMKQLLRIACLR